MKPVRLFSARCSLLGATSLFCLLLLQACASSKNGAATLGLEEPDLTFVDVFLKGPPPNRANTVGTMTAIIQVHNPNEEAITLQKIEVTLSGSSELRTERRTQPVSKKIEPGGTTRIAANMLYTIAGIQTQQAFQISPLSLQGRAFFSSETGNFQIGFVRNQVRPGQAARGRAGDESSSNEEGFGGED